MHATERFSSRVEDYVRSRPSYPSAAIDLLATRCGLSPAAVVADIGSGTGILTELLLESGAQVIPEDLESLNVCGVETELVLLFKNLIGNGIKFRADRPVQVRVGAERHAEFWRFHVQDNGIGIANEYLGRLFRMGERLHSRTQYPGHGIGLATCKKIVERHGGQIWVESEPDRGSTFFFTLPAA